jgi:hypothetical protein
VEDVSRYLPGGRVGVLGVTSQNAGNQSFEDRAKTAPGTPPAGQLDVLPGEILTHQAPEITAIGYDTPVLRGPDGASVTPDLAGRSNPYSRDDGAGWRAAEPLPPVTGRSLIRRGEWNSI